MPRVKRKPTRSPAPSDVPSHLLSAPKKRSTAIQFDQIDLLFESYANKSSGLIEANAHVYMLGQAILLGIDCWQPMEHGLLFLQTRNIKLDDVMMLNGRPEGIEALCKDVHMDCTDVRMLILAWKMKAVKQGYFSKFDALTRSNHNPLIPLNDTSLMSSPDEWRRGLKCLGADTITKLRKEIDVIDKEVMIPENFEDFYSFAFQYNLIEDKQKTVDIEAACELLNVVLRLVFPTQVNLLIEFLKIQNEYGALNRDQWRSFYRFFKEVSIRDLQNYDPSQAWPVVVDNFVEWLKQKEKMV